MAITRHESVLAALENRANRFSSRGNLRGVDVGLVNSALDETGTIDTSLFCNTYENNERLALAEQQEATRVTELGVPEEVLQIHGEAPGSKPEGVFRLIYENVNGISNRLTGNDKVEKAKEIHDELEVDLVAYNEHRLNMQDRQNCNGFNQLFKGGEATVKSVVAHNVHENFGRVQEGGTSLMAFGPITEYLMSDEPGKDESGLGRWAIMTFKGDVGRTRVVCGYNPCYNARPDSSTTYQQHRRFLITHRKDLTCPRVKFREDLVGQLQKWREDSDKLIVCLDSNEHIYRKAIGKALTDVDGLAMKEVVGDFTGKQIGSTFFRGKKPIDGVWATSDITISNAAIMPAGYGIGDHRLFVIDMAAADIVGSIPPKIIRPSSRRLNTKLPRVADVYSRLLEEQIIKHRLIERVGKAHTKSRSRRSLTRRLNRLDAELGTYMRYAEKQCRKIKSGRIPFSPEASVWIRRTQIYRSLLRYHAGKIRNRGNLKRAARRCGIPYAWSLSIQEIYFRLQACVNKCDYFRKHGKYYRRKHLYTRLEAAKEKEDEEAAKQILAIIQREKDKSFWRRLNYALGATRGGACFQVQVSQEDGTIREHTGQDDLQDAIWSNIHMKRFHLAESAALCSGNLRGIFGYNAICQTSHDILAGTYDYPPDFDVATTEILIECAAIRLQIPKSSVSSLITREDWGNHWGRAKEETSSSISQRHFGHYKAGLRSPYVSHLQALISSLTIKHGIVLDRWSQGLSVMLEKIPGCSLITKLRSILLMEADFNATNKTIYGVRMLHNVRKYRLMPEEVFSERNRLADDGTLSKVLFFDIARQLRRPAGLASVDADNCYDRIAHPMASMVFQAFGVPTGPIRSMLTTLQDLRFYLRTGYGDSKGYVGGNKGSSVTAIKNQGMCQGNTASPAAWTVVSIPMISAHKKKGHGAHFLTPMGNFPCHLAGGLFVDDNDLFHLDMRRTESAAEAHANLQEAVINWGKLLLATGGALKPEKCSFYLISFKWKADGTWVYDKNELKPDFALGVPMADGSLEEIDHLPVSTATKTLGSMTCPSGNSSAAIERMKVQGQEWVDKVLASKLSRRNMWFMVDCQLWPRVGYGICNNAGSWGELETCMQRVYWQLVGRGGVRRSAPVALRQLDRGFFGIGCPHPGVECLVGQVSKLLVHYGCKSGVGIEMQVSMEIFATELGMSAQPMQVSHATYGKCITTTWLKTVWEKVDKFGIKIEIAPLALTPPRVGDKWFMQAVRESGITHQEEWAAINRFRCHQQVLFLSDILDAGGKSIDKKYLSPREDHEVWSTLIFPLERPPRRHTALWRSVIYALAPRGRIQNRLGRFLTKGHKIWEWRYHTETNRLLKLNGAVMDVYTPSGIPLYSNRPNFWTRSRIGVPAEVIGEICSVKSVALAVYSILTTAVAAPTPQPPSNLWTAIEEWGETWLWNNLTIRGDTSWLEEAIADNSLMAVTDGSYIKEIYPHINSAAFVFECSKGRGRLWGSFVEHTPDAGSYRGELLGLMAIHLILRGVSVVSPNLTGSVLILSDCLGALKKVSELPPYRIPTKCSHSDILKNIMVNCSDLGFSLTYSHVKAHQDNGSAYGSLSRDAQLNCQMDYHAKRAIHEANGPQDIPTRRFPLEPICVFLGKNKLTSDKGERLRYWMHKQLAKNYFHEKSILVAHQFEKVDWDSVHTALRRVPRMFQIWACKQVMDIAPANGNRPWERDLCPLCPSCAQVPETCAHILFCQDEGRVDVLLKSIDLIASWLAEVDTDPDLRDCIIEYAKGRGGLSMSEICYNLDRRFQLMAQDQDEIGWRRFMEGMICQRMRAIQEEYTVTDGSQVTPDQWASGVVIKLLEATHGQWLYRCIQIHDKVQGTLVTQRKEELQREIEEQMDQGFDGLLEEDQFLGEVNLEDLENTSGERQEYWLVAMRAAREARLLRGVSQQNMGRTTTARDGRFTN